MRYARIELVLAGVDQVPSEVLEKAIVTRAQVCLPGLAELVNVNLAVGEAVSSLRLGRGWV